MKADKLKWLVENVPDGDWSEIDLIGDEDIFWIYLWKEYWGEKDFPTCLLINSDRIPEFNGKDELPGNFADSTEGEDNFEEFEAWRLRVFKWDDDQKIFRPAKFKVTAEFI